MRRDIFQSIADPTRRAIIALITIHAMTLNAIAENFDISRQAISKHLRILLECELISQVHEGRKIYYSIKIEKKQKHSTRAFLKQSLKDTTEPWRNRKVEKSRRLRTGKRVVCPH